MHPRLILIEGTPGSGKTTTARYVQKRLEEWSHSACIVLEGDLNHPADYESVAWFDFDGYAQILRAFPQQAQFLRSAVVEHGKDYFIPYRKLRLENDDAVYPPALFDALARAEIYEQPPEVYCRLALDQWQRFTSSAYRQDTPYIFECCFLQNPITVLLGRYNLDPAAILDHLQRAAEITQPLVPLLIYLDPGDVRRTLEDAAADRPREWLDAVIHYTTGQAFGAARGITGFDGMTRFYEAMRDLQHTFLHRWGGTSLALSRVTTWTDRYAAIDAFLSEQFL